jgi:hypothetical protein
MDTVQSVGGLIGRFQKSAILRRYLRARMRLVVPAALVFLAFSVACAAATVVFLADRSRYLALPALLLAPLVLVGSVCVQAYIFFSWLEQRALPQSPALDVPWGLAIALVLLPLAALAVVSPWLAAGILLGDLLVPVVYALLDRATPR